tara:strand:- start:2262 stop:2822 length:561 start_codon:yes stop_codon:yes gene_type:complete
MFQKLINPKTETYKLVKQFALSPEFPWFYVENATPQDVSDDKFQTVPFYSHVLIARPKWQGIGGNYMFPEPQSEHLTQFYPLLEEIMVANEIPVTTLLRYNVNCTHPQEDDRLSTPHIDHPYPHKNIIVYLQGEGDTVCFPDGVDPSWSNADSFTPEEDDVVVFEGLHCMRPPETGRRIVLVATFI